MPGLVAETMRDQNGVQRVRITRADGSGLRILKDWTQDLEAYDIRGVGISDVRWGRSPDELLVSLHSTPTGTGGTSVVFSVNTIDSSLELLQIGTHAIAGYFPVWSPDGTRMLTSFSHYGRMAITEWDFNQQAIRVLTDLNKEVAVSPNYDPSGRRITYALKSMRENSWSDHVYIHDLSTNEKYSVTDLDPLIGVYGVHWSRCGKYIVYVVIPVRHPQVIDQQTKIVVHEVETGVDHVILRTDQEPNLGILGWSDDSELIGVYEQFPDGSSERNFYKLDGTVHASHRSGRSSERPTWSGG